MTFLGYLKSRLWFFQWSCVDVRVGLYGKLSAEELMLLDCGVGEDSWESLGLQGDQTSQFCRKSVLGVHCKDWCWSWNSNTLATWCEELTHLKRPWCWKRLRTRGEGGDRMKWLDSIIDSMDMSLRKLRKIMKDKEFWHASGHGLQSQTRLSDWTTGN